MLLDTTDKSSLKDFSGSRPEPGIYHVAINMAEEKASKNKGTPGLEVEFSVLAGTTEGQEGKNITAFLSAVGDDESKTKTCINQLTKLAVCCEILGFRESKEVDWNEAIGREILVKIESQKYKDRKTGEEREGTGVAFMGFWPVDGGSDAVAVKDVPRDPTTPRMQEWAKSMAGKTTTATTTAAKPKATTSAASNAGPAASTSAAPKKDWKSLV
ncbi:DUF669 domain-containing protein [Trichococcus shcherbakoviae]|uniref:DUF669 domain-containing protein n=1 Tax=Trichococcus shcherbakoviae TaxID=2094020 RepID=UPI002AA7132C|nr:DUF669 domain-containing protein [Trichococcus shcherbakoviae]